MRVATRRSALARAQAFQTARALAGDDAELVPLRTTADREPDKLVADFGTKGLFVDALREAVLDGDCDIAVHSYKDLPTEPVDGLVVGAVPPRADARDLLVTRDGHALSTLPRISTVGTSSERRRVQLLRARPDLQVISVRGNLDTRLRKVHEGEFDAIVVALAGLQRLYTPEEDGGVGPLGLPLHAVPLEPGECLPSPAQGALAVECRRDDAETRKRLARVEDAGARATVTAERSFLATVGGGCLAPIGALATELPGRVLELAAMLADPGRRKVLRRSLRGPIAEPERLGRELAQQMLADGGEQLVAAVQERRDREAGG
ncbi:hydroxymethylbilane synthase [Egibacter rhizosphaerae]|uniref:Porphobilinogen deaminase n=1 Tax=Egibacter rhizosphaerae TaxID=1670831 RepID=A0A411YGN4_9ACTN|nr:hydroxymethylbilane synthase [Egibacter rhizosphaerae]QBI20329.1 hydroxymethylbilane synthase [Egibacter rhizosphaerae]